MISGVLPGHEESISDFLDMARRLDGEEISEEDLASAVAALPELTEARLESLAEHSQAQAHKNPRLGWAIAKVADETAVQQNIERPLLARSAWYLGRAANNYSRPQKASTALDRARMAFTDLGDEDWVAACDWQEHVLAWAKPDLSRSAAEIRAVLDRFSNPNSALVKFRAECCQTLAYIEMLIGNNSESLKLLQASDEVFQTEENTLGLIKSHFIRGNAFRRQSEFERAIVELESCINLSKTESAPVYKAIGRLQLAMVFTRHRPSSGTYGDAEQYYLEAAGKFTEFNLTFWQAISLDGLAVIYISQGKLVEAGAALATCREVYRDLQVRAPLAGTLTMSGWLETYRANYGEGQSYLLEAEALLQTVGNKLMMGICQMHLGELYLEMGRYQQALHHLERAGDFFQELKSGGRMAENGLRLARCWTFLGRPDLALDVLDFVEENARNVNQANIFPYLHIRKAESLVLAKKQTEAVEVLRSAESAANRLKDRTGVALTKRLLGDVFIDLARWDEAVAQIAEAETIFDEVGLVVDQAACKIAWGHYYRKLGDTQSARTALQEAADIVEDLAPDITWQAEAGLAYLAEDMGDDSSALVHYRNVISSLVRLRQDMWQPTLAGSFFKRPVDTLNKALRLAVRLGFAEEVLNIIEAGKAQVMAHLFGGQNFDELIGKSPELANLSAEIRWYQEKARASNDNNSWLATADLRDLRLKIQEMVKDYDKLRSRVERQYKNSRGDFQSTSSEFNLDLFRKAADRKFGTKWLAIDYYLTNEKLTCVIIDSLSIEFVDLGIPGRVRIAFEDLDYAQQTGRWTKSNLEALGNWLLPEAVHERLAADTVLVIAPHSQLHRLPWSALTAGNQALVAKAVPVVVPSLQSLAVLMSRKERDLESKKGLFVAVSEFGNRHHPLPNSVAEVESLHRLFPNSETLYEEAATWEGLLEELKGDNITAYSFFHIASHAFPDKITGRLSGLALSDRDVWLDELWELAPLPQLVTLSACSGSKSRFYEGDEQVGLATTCLAAGADHVVASLWPIQDKEAADFMKTFYSHLLLGEGPAGSLALAQRAAARSGAEVGHWAGYRCTGMPA